MCLYYITHSKQEKENVDLFLLKPLGDSVGVKIKSMHNRMYACTHARTHATVMVAPEYHAGGSSLL